MFEAGFGEKRQVRFLDERLPRCCAVAMSSWCGTRMRAVVLIATAAFNATANAMFASGFVGAGQLLVLPGCVYLGSLVDGFIGTLRGMVIGQLAIALLCVGSVSPRAASRGRERKPQRRGHAVVAS